MEQKLEIPVIKKNSKLCQLPYRPKETAAKGMIIDLIFILQRPQVLNPITDCSLQTLFCHYSSFKYGKSCSNNLI